MGYNSTCVNYTNAIATNPGGSNTAGYLAAQAIDNNLTTKFFDGNGPPTTFIIDFQSTMLVNMYTYVTGGDAIDRDPISWTMSGSNDNTNWIILDTRTNYNVPITRNYQLPWFQVPA